jgi:hypothetical protein
MPLLGDKYQPMGMKATCQKFMKTSGTQSKKKKKKEYWGSHLKKVVKDSKICKGDGVHVNFISISVCNQYEGFVCCSDQLQQKL